MSSMFQQKDASQCKGIKKNGERCCKKTLNNYCNYHYRQYEKDERYTEESCPVCMEDFSFNFEPLAECGHWVHHECIAKSRKQICPVCRVDVKINFEYIPMLIINKLGYKYSGDFMGNNLIFLILKDKEARTELCNELRARISYSIEIDNKDDINYYTAKVKQLKFLRGFL